MTAANAEDAGFLDEIIQSYNGGNAGE